MERLSDDGFVGTGTRHQRTCRIGIRTIGAPVEIDGFDPTVFGNGLNADLAELVDLADITLRPPVVPRSAATLPVQMTCDAVGDGRADERVFSANLQGSEFSMVKGRPNSSRYEIWVGTVDRPRGLFSLYGQFKDGARATIREIFLVSPINADNIVAGTGLRGTRICNFIIDLGSSNG